MKWSDAYGNVTGYSLDADLGSIQNPIVSKDRKQWTMEGDGVTWVSSSGDRRTVYPGKPTPTPPYVQKLRSAPFKSNEKYARIAMRRLGRQRGRVGFGNARAVNRCFDMVRDRQARRLARASKEDAKEGGGRRYFPLYARGFVGSAPL
jgi:hypothetical protein